MTTLAVEERDDLESRVIAARYGVIEAFEGRVVSIHFRLLPKLLTFSETLWMRRLLAPWRRGDRCRLYYNQPLGTPRFLALKYLVSEPGATLATVNAAVKALDAVARVKCSDAILCQAWNGRLSEAMLSRWGWTRHCERQRGRHFIKRFYGEYPETPLLEELFPTSGNLGSLAGSA